MACFDVDNLISTKKRAWKKIIIIVEGIYSMEGDILPLKEILQVTKKYGCYLYVDEAHSIGALGKGGRGVCEHAGVDPNDVDILMGTFTKSFGAVGGYIAASKEVVDFLRLHCFSFSYDTSISVPAIQQCLSALDVISGSDGTGLGHKRILQLRDNSNYFRARLRSMGFHIVGDRDSPIIPLMFVPFPSKI